MMIKPNLDRNEREAMAVSQRHDHELIKLDCAGIVLLTAATAFWIVAAGGVNTLSHWLRH